MRFKRNVNPYPYHGYFYSESAVSTAVPLDRRTIGETLVYESDCDIQESGKSSNPVLIATYSVFLPFDLSQNVPFARGDRFSASMNGINVNGKILNVIPSQLGGIVCSVKDYDAD